jgi:hypothetical protein
LRTIGKETARRFEAVLIFEVNIQAAGQLPGGRLDK